MAKEYFYPIRYVSQRTGLTSHVIRAWEKRYQAVIPHRTEKNRRLYCEKDVQRLQLLKKIINAGHNISQIAQLDQTELNDLAQQEASLAPRTRADSGIRPVAGADKHYQTCLSAVLNLDHGGLECCYDQAAIELTRTALLRDVIFPLFEEIGNLWRDGNLKILNEHMATTVTRNLLLNLLRATETSDSAPSIFIATMAGQWHDVGALSAALMAAENGWHSVYFGPNLPVEEIAAGAKHVRARAVAVSITHFLDPIPLFREILKLRSYIEKDVALFVGGRAVEGHLHMLEEINAIYIRDFKHFGRKLTNLRT